MKACRETAEAMPGEVNSVKCVRDCLGKAEVVHMGKIWEISVSVISLLKPIVWKLLQLKLIV